MNKQELHRLHYLLNEALYHGMEESKMPSHLKWIQEALEMIKSQIREGENEYEMGT